MAITSRPWKLFGRSSTKAISTAKHTKIPTDADVVVIGDFLYFFVRISLLQSHLWTLFVRFKSGGGSAGCYTTYHLAKLGVRTILLERHRLTSGTTWHTNGLMWRIRANDVDIQ